MSFSKEECLELIINSFGKVLITGGDNIRKRMNYPLVYNDGFRFIEEYILYNTEQLYTLVSNPVIENSVNNWRKMNKIVRENDTIYNWALDFLDMYKYLLPYTSGLIEPPYKINVELDNIFNEKNTKMFCLQLLQSYPIPIMY